MNKISRKILSFGITLCILLSVFSGVVFAKDNATRIEVATIFYRFVKANK